MFGGLPENVAGLFVERHNARIVSAADVQEHGLSLDKRRADHAVPFFGDTKFVRRIDIPELCARVQVDAMQRALCAESVDLSVVDCWRGARPIIEMDAVAKGA